MPFLLAAVVVAFAQYAFFIWDRGATPPADPQVFVKDEAAQAASGPQSIAHDAGLRPALVSSDLPGTPLFGAHGAPLGISIGQWMSAAGTIEVATLNPNAQQVTVSLRGLSPYGVYSVFVNRTPGAQGSDAPLDGAGTGNSVVADAGGTARMMLLVTPPLTSGTVVTVVFHSDGAPHGMSAGAPGVTSHVQLAATLSL